MRGANFTAADSDRYRVEVREPRVRMTVYLPSMAWCSAEVSAALDRLTSPTIADIPFEASPPGPGLFRRDLRLSRKHRGIIELVARTHHVPLSEALRGILAGMEAGV